MFSIGTINLPEIIQFVKTIDVEIMDIDVKNNISKQGFGVHSIKKNIPSNRYESEVALKDEVYPKICYNH